MPRGYERMQVLELAETVTRAIEEGSLVPEPTNSALLSSWGRRDRSLKVIRTRMLRGKANTYINHRPQWKEINKGKAPKTPKGQVRGGFVKPTSSFKQVKHLKESPLVHRTPQAASKYPLLQSLKKSSIKVNQGKVSLIKETAVAKEIATPRRESPGARRGLDDAFKQAQITPGMPSGLKTPLFSPSFLRYIETQGTYWGRSGYNGPISPTQIMQTRAHMRLTEELQSLQGEDLEDFLKLFGQDPEIFQEQDEQDSDHGNDITLPYNRENESDKVIEPEKEKPSLDKRDLNNSTEYNETSVYPEEEVYVSDEASPGVEPVNYSLDSFMTHRATPLDGQRVNTYPEGLVHAPRWHKKEEGVGSQVNAVDTGAVIPPPENKED